MAATNFNSQARSISRGLDIIIGKEVNALREKPLSKEAYSSWTDALTTKRTFLLLAFNLVLIHGYGQQSSYSTEINYVLTTDFLKEGVTPQTNIGTLSPSELRQTVQYFDGLGRPSQTVQVGNSPLGKDLVVPFAYDVFGRESVKYLPYARGVKSGLYVSGAFTEQNTFYQNAVNVAHDGAPFQELIFESSPLNRILKTGSAGQAWQPDQDPLVMGDRTVKRKYEGNTFGEVLRLKYDATTETIGVSELPEKKYYSANSLFKNTTLDEHNNEVIEFVDSEGRTLCKKVQYGEDAYATTCYVYDDFGNLIAVLPPELMKRLTK